jgi:putative chitinase
MIALNVNQLQTAANVSRDIARMWFEPLNLGAAEAFVNSPRRWAMWIAQLAHESGGFSRLVESLDYTPEALMRTWPTRFDRDLAQALGRTPGRPAAQRDIAERAYGNRMGNRKGHSDGWTYRGRGIIQLTGRENYSAAGLALRIDLLGNPDLARRPDIAARIAANYWRTRNVNGFADAADVIGATRAINGGTNGLLDRVTRYQLARDALKAS